MKRKLLSCLFFVLNINLSIFAHDGKVHVQDMANVLGASISGNNNLESLLKLVTNSVDDHTGNTIQDSIYGGSKYYQIGYNVNFYKALQSKYPTFKYTTDEYTHRILFHWGFDKIDRDLIKKNITPNYPLYYSFYEYVDNYQSRWPAFVKEIEKVQKEKASQLTMAFYEFFEFSDGNASAYNLAALCYYTHILGDHIEFSRELAVKSVMSVDNIIYELNSVVSKLAGSGLGSSYYKEYAKEIESLQLRKNKLKGGDKEYAEIVLYIMRKYIPKIIKLNYFDYFNKKGIILY